MQNAEAPRTGSVVLRRELGAGSFQTWEATSLSALWKDCADVAARIRHEEEVIELVFRRWSRATRAKRRVIEEWLDNYWELSEAEQNPAWLRRIGISASSRSLGARQPRRGWRRQFFDDMIARSEAGSWYTDRIAHRIAEFKAREELSP